jgi:aryl-alcohol dehydrogenase-like predicted oxidoreductase
MEYRTLGNTALQVSSLGFGCGAVGGILVKGDKREMVRAVARAMDAGITYFDTAAVYGDGLSETNLGIALKEVGGGRPVIGTKIRMLISDLDNIAASVPRLVDESLKRLGRDSVDLMQLHNFLAVKRINETRWLSSRMSRP